MKKLSKLLACILMGASLVGCTPEQPTKPEDPYINNVVEWTSNNVSYQDYDCIMTYHNGVLIDERATCKIKGETHTGKLYLYLVDCMFYNEDKTDTVYGLLELKMLVEEDGTQNIVYDKLTTKSLEEEL